jgi:general secretion pathway protein D
MIACNRLRELVSLAAILLLLPVDGLEARTRKGDKFLKQARAAEARKDYEQALDLYSQAISQDPQDPAYQLGARRVRFQAAQLHVENGVRMRREGQLEQALVEFQRAFNIDPGSAVALQEIQHTKEALDQKNKGTAPPGEQPMSSAEKARKESLAMIQSLLPVPELKPVTNQITLLKMNNQPPRVLYETVGKLAGINVLFDPQYQATKNANLDLNNATLDEALDYIAMLTKTFWKPISANAIFVTDDNVTKRRDYEDEVVKVFYLKNPTSVQEFQEIVTSVRSVTDVRRMFTYNAQNAVMVRDTVDKVALVEKLFHDMDKAKAEVVVDVVVMEANSSKTRTLAAGLVSGGAAGLNLPITFSRNSTTSTTTPAPTATNPNPTPVTTPTSSPGTIPLSRIFRISSNDFSTTLPGALLQAVMSDNSTRVMQSPQVRASDGQKVSLKIGDKVPYATGSFQPGIGSVGVSPLVSTQFQFAETGVNLEITPHVHGTDELTMHITIDVSNVSRTVTIGGLDQPVISQRKNEADIRVRDGEVSLLGGLMQDQNTNSQSGIPGLTNIPILGKFLFGSNTRDRERGELLVALIPHIVRTPDVSGLDLRGVAAGTDQTVKLSYGARSLPATPATPAPAPAAPAATAPATTAPAATPTLSFVPPAAQAQLSAPVVLVLQADGMTDLTGVPVKLKWDPKILKLNSAVAGTLLTRDGTVNQPTLDIRNDAGEASIEMTRAAGTAGVNGSGPLMQFTFLAVAKGSTAITASDAILKNSKGQSTPVAAPSMTVVVQ